MKTWTWIPPHCCACPKPRLGFIYVVGFVLVFDELRWDVIVCYVEIGGIVDHHCLYNNTPSKAIVNAASIITYRPLIQADDTGRCTVIIWNIFETRLISFTLSFKWENYLNSFSNKTVTISLDRQPKKLCFFSTTLLLYKLDTLLLKQKKLSVLDLTGFFFRIRTQVKALVLRTSAFTWVLMRKKKPVISNTGCFFCFNSTVSYT